MRILANNLRMREDDDSCFLNKSFKFSKQEKRLLALVMTINSFPF